MKLLITGSQGFVGRNLIAELNANAEHTIFEYDKDSDPSDLDVYTKEADFVFHLAGVNRPVNIDDFMEGNYGLTSTLLTALESHDNRCPVMISSSIQAELDNPYGRSKLAGEELLFEYGRKTGTKVLVYRFQNIFGKWCRPNYNSVVATFCHNIANDLPITVNNADTILDLVYIDDVVQELIGALAGEEHLSNEHCYVPVHHEIKLGDLANLLYSFKESRTNLLIPDMSSDLTKKLYSTYLSYLPTNQFHYDLKMNVDQRGSFTEFIRTKERGQVSVNISKPGITKGNHWHHTKNEKFLVVSGYGVIRFRQIGVTDIIEYHVSGERLQVVDIPPGYTHNIENIGDEDMVTIMWANEPFNPEVPDTMYLEVSE